MKFTFFYICVAALSSQAIVGIVVVAMVVGLLGAGVGAVVCVRWRNRRTYGHVTEGQPISYDNPLTSYSTYRQSGL